VFDEVRRVLKPSGTCWVVIGDSYAGSWGNYGGKNRGNGTQRAIVNGSQCVNPAYEQFTARPATSNPIAGIKPKDLCGIPWRFAFALQERGWYLRQDIIWAKPAPMPESVTDRCTRSHEYVFLLTKQARYYYDHLVISEPSKEPPRASRGGSLTRNSNDKYISGESHHGAPAVLNGWGNKRDVWFIQSEPYAAAHFATFPTKLVETCILAGSPTDGVVLDPFAGCGTTGEVAVKLGRRAILIELNEEYTGMIRHNLGLWGVNTNGYH